MAKNQPIKRLKIAEQIIIVCLFAVIIPFSISGIIINNVNQQSVRAQLCNTATIIANSVSDSIDVFDKTIKFCVNEIVEDINEIPDERNRQIYLNKASKNATFYKQLFLVQTEEQALTIKENALKHNEVVFYKKTNKGNYLVAKFDIKTLKENLFNSTDSDSRQIYVLDKNRTLISSYNYVERSLNKAIKQLPKKLEKDTAVIYGEKKNQPFVYIQKSNPEALIIVNTPRKLTKTYIEHSRVKIILSVIIAVLAVLLIFGLYISYLYINIRQLFKAIMAISKGNYKRRIRLLTHIFTPYEIIFLATEFNRMANQIHKSYIKLEKKNKELQELNEFRSNMIDTVSHEFRTPLTSILGYTTRLLRQDINLNEEMKQKSLKIIKKQSERLSRMIEDLLVIPDIEGAKLNVNMKPLNIYTTVEDSLLLVKNNSNKTIVNNVDINTPEIMADKDRFEQVIINLVENAVKYSYDDTEIIVESEDFDEEQVKITVKNQCNIIPKDKLKQLFDKFTRLDDSTTRTTRGTGLGLFIVKGLIESMDGRIHLHSNNKWGFTVQIFMKKAKNENSDS